MGLNEKIKRRLSFLLSDSHRPVYANISYLKPDNRLDGCKIVVTGGSRGLGLSMARKFKDEGADVLITGRSEAVVSEVARLIGCHYLVLDVEDVQAFGTFMEQADRVLGGMTSLVCNAGVSLHEKDFFQVTEYSFDKQINTNLRGTVFLAQAFIRLQTAKEANGNILFISSEVGELSDNRPYGWTKASVNSMVKGLAANFAEQGIRINALAPGITCSDMTGLKPDGDLYLAKNATKRAYLPEEVAEIATFLLSECSSCLSGQIIVCNNGKTINSRCKKQE